MTKAKAHERIIWLDKQIEMQENALLRPRCNAVVHTYLLQKCTDEWCELVKKYGIPEQLLQ